MKIAIFCVLCAVLAGGCIVPSDVDKAVQNVNTNTDHAREELSKEHQAMSTPEVQAKLEELASAEDKRVNELEAKMRETIKVQQEHEKQIGLNAVKLLEEFGSLTPGAPIVGTIAPFVNNLLSKSADDVNKTTDLKLVPINSVLSSTKVLADDAQKTATSVQLSQKELDAKFSALTTELKEKFNRFDAADKDQVQKIQEALNKDPALGERMLNQALASKGFTTAEIDKLHNDFSPSEIIGFILTGIAGAGGGTVASRLGKSRGAEAVKSVEDQQGQHESRLDSLEKTAAATGQQVHVNTTSLSEIRNKAEDLITKHVGTATSLPVLASTVEDLDGRLVAVSEAVNGLKDRLGTAPASIADLGIKVAAISATSQRLEVTVDMLSKMTGTPNGVFSQKSQPTEAMNDKVSAILTDLSDLSQAVGKISTSIQELEDRLPAPQTPIDQLIAQVTELTDSVATLKESIKLQAPPLQA